MLLKGILSSQSYALFVSWTPWSVWLPWPCSPITVILLTIGQKATWPRNHRLRSLKLRAKTSLSSFQFTSGVLSQDRVVSKTGTSFMMMESIATSLAFLPRCPEQTHPATLPNCDSRNLWAIAYILGLGKQNQSLAEKSLLSLLLRECSLVFLRHLKFRAVELGDNWNLLFTLPICRCCTVI